MRHDTSMNTFLYCLAISLSVHTAFLGWMRLSPSEKRGQAPEIVFQQTEPQPVVKQWIPPLPELPMKVPPYLKQEQLDAAQKDLGLDKPVLPAESESTMLVDEQEKDALERIARKLSVSKQVMAEIKQTPAYMEYYEFIRNKIKSAAMQRYTATGEGDVGIVFILSRRGDVVAAGVDKSFAQSSETLKRMALESVTRSSPFPTFPPELNYQNLEFSLTIHFRRKN